MHAFLHETFLGKPGILCIKTFANVGLLGLGRGVVLSCMAMAQ